VNLSRPIFWLLFLNIVDAFVTLIWVRSGIAPESNQIMAALLDVGDMPFLLAKIGMGVITAVVLYYGSEYRLARIGVTTALAVYSPSHAVNLGGLGKGGPASITMSA